VKATTYRPAKRTKAAAKRIRTGKILAAVIVAVAVLGGIYWWNSGDRLAGRYAFAVGSPGPGKEAPPVTLPTTGGGEFDLAKLRGKRVLLYFQEGVTCEPCWNQIRDIDADLGEFRALGIDTVATIAADPVSALKRLAGDYKLATPVLADTTLAVSNAYHANLYGMMGTSRDGHSFILVGRDGRIEWRADYGGPPQYTMYLPVRDLLADIRRGLRNKAAE
jgi:peroxiredoxin